MAYTVRDLSNAQRFEYKGYEVFMYCVEDLSLIHIYIRHRHSIDLLVADICIFFQWFNPGAWLLKQELQNIHEYERCV